MLNEILEFFAGLIQYDKWPARWHCGYWSQFHGWLYIFSSFGIALSYFSIPFYIFKVVKARGQNFKFAPVLWIFILFIFFCGTTHLLDGIIFWVPVYRFAALNLFFTCCISWVAVLVLRSYLPSFLDLRTQEQLETMVIEKTKQLSESNQYLINLNNDLDNFMYSASHDLKAPVNNLESLLAMARDESESKAEISVTHQYMEDQIGRLKTTLSRLTDVIKLQRSPYEDNQMVEMQVVLDEFCLNNQTLLSRSDVKITADFKVDTIYFSRVGMEVIVSNLLGNSIKYASPERPVDIRISTFKDTDQTVLQIKDNGIGIDLKKHYDKVFGLFKRFHNHVEGSGIGLFIVKKLVEKKGGWIEVESKLNEGTTFTIKFNKQ